MVWKESGKYGVNTGRPVRNPFSRFCNETAWIRSAHGRESELLLKFTRGTQNMSSREMEQFLSENDPLYHDGNVTWTSEDRSPLPLSVNI